MLRGLHFSICCATPPARRRAWGQRPARDGDLDEAETQKIEESNADGGDAETILPLSFSANDDNCAANDTCLKSGAAEGVALCCKKERSSSGWSCSFPHAYSHHFRKYHFASSCPDVKRQYKRVDCCCRKEIMMPQLRWARPILPT